VDKRADIWAFGVVLFEMLTGRRPFGGREATDAVAEILKSEPAWEALPADVPPPVRRLLRRCLQKDPRWRLQHIGDARLELHEAGTPDARRDGAEPPRSRRSALAWGMAAVSTAVVALALMALFGPRADTASRDPMRFSTVTNFSGVEAQPSFSPDGRSIAFVSNRGGQWDIYVGLVTGGSLIRITEDVNLETTPRWSPDGTRILFGRLNETGRQDVWTAPALGGTARRVVANALQPAWSSDGRSIAYSSEGTIWTADAGGANPRAITSPERFRADYQPAFSRDGRRVAFIRRRGPGLGGPYGALVVVDVTTGAEKYLTVDDAMAVSPVWSLDDRFVYLSWSRGGALNVWKIPVDGGEPEQITVGQGDDTEIDLSSDGTRLVFSSFRVNVNLAEMSLDERPPSGALRWLTSDSARGERRPAYAPDGRRIAFFSNRVGAEQESIWVMNADGTAATRVVEEEGRLSIFPRWAGDGQELVFLSRSASASSGLDPLEQTSELRRVALSGGAPQSLSIRPWSPAWGDVAADGRIIYRTSADTGAIFDPKTGERHPVAALTGDPLWSRDGRSFAFLVPPQSRSAEPGVYVETIGGGRQLVFPGWANGFAWHRESLVVLEGKPDLKGMLWRVDRDGRKELLLAGVPLLVADLNVEIPPARFDVSPDGRRLVLEALESFESDIGMIASVR
jgi:eukaryotic-like serine/threonine-protein kinase